MHVRYVCHVQLHGVICTRAVLDLRVIYIGLRITALLLLTVSAGIPGTWVTLVLEYLLDAFTVSTSTQSTKGYPESGVSAWLLSL